MGPASEVVAWRPPLRGVAEVLHARFRDHAYPVHVHDTWTLLVVDSGRIGYDLDRHEHAALTSQVTLLPPHVPHNGHSESVDGFRKRVLYLEEDVLGAQAIGRAVDTPTFLDPVLRHGISQLDRSLADADTLEAESRLALVADRLRWHLSGLTPEGGPPAKRVAHEARAALDAQLFEQVTLADVAATVGVTPTHVVRSFSAEFGLPPHQYVISRRLDRARRLLLDGAAPSDVAVSTGFHDQAHLTRHFKRMLSTTPGAYQRSKHRGPAPENR